MSHRRMRYTGANQTASEEFVAAILKRIVCLANAQKPGGRCVAGKEIFADGHPGGWIRPVSGREGQGVSQQERRLADGGEPSLLDIIDVSLVEARPKLHQRENWLLDPDLRWERVCRISPDQLMQFTDPLVPLWRSGHNSNNGLNDKIPDSLAEFENSSLRLIRVDRLRVEVFQPGIDFGNHRRRVQGQFRYAGTRYRLWITDPEYEERYLELDDGEYGIGECYLTISLGGLYYGYAYKLIAGVIEPGCRSMR